MANTKKERAENHETAFTDKPVGFSDLKFHFNGKEIEGIKGFREKVETDRGDFYGNTPPPEQTQPGKRRVEIDMTGKAYDELLKGHKGKKTLLHESLRVALKISIEKPEDTQSWELYVTNVLTEIGMEHRVTIIGEIRDPKKGS